MRLTDLPREILLCIIAYLSDVDVCRLRATNHNLRQLAIDQYFNHFKIRLDSVHTPDKPSNYSTFQRLRTLNVPGNANRVKVLTIDFVDFTFDRYYYPLPSIRKFIANTLLSNFTVLYRKKTPAFGVLELNLPYITTLEIQSVHEWFSAAGMAWGSSIVHKILASSFQRITTLVFNVAIYYLPFFLPSSAIILPQLQTLKINLFLLFGTLFNEDLGHEPIDDILTKRVSPFINQHASSLRTLDLGIPLTWKLRDFFTDLVVNVGHLLKYMPQFPHLSTLCIVIGGSTNVSQVQDFLNRNATTLRELTFQFTPMRHKDTVPTSSLLIPSLTPRLQVDKLALKYIKSPVLRFDQIAQAISFICYHPLTSLQILGIAHRPQAALQFFDPNTGIFRKGSRLRSLQISLEEMTPAMFDILANNLTDLHDLSLEVYRWPRRRPTADMYTAMVGTEHEFAVEMRKRSYLNWNLQHLSSTYSESCNPPKRSDTCFLAIVMAVPSIRSVDCISRADYVYGAREYAINNPGCHLPQQPAP